VDFASVRIAIIPTRYVKDDRFYTLASHVLALNEIPVSALPVNGSEIRRKSFLYSGSYNMSSPLSNPGVGVDKSSESATAVGLDRTESAAKYGRLVAASAAIDAVKQSDLKQKSNYEAFDESLEDETRIHIRYEICRRTMSGAVLVPSSSEWEAFHTCKRTWGVIAVADLSDDAMYPNVDVKESAVKGAIDDLKVVMNQLKTVSLSKLVVFVSESAVSSLSTSSLVLSNSHSIQSSVGIVADHASSSAITRAEVRAQVLHFLGGVLDFIENEMISYRKGERIMTTPLDAQSIIDADSSMLSRRKEGRIHKIVGDHLLLLGAASDALSSFKSASEQCRANSDRLWLAGAIEGEIATLLVHVGFKASFVYGASKSAPIATSNTKRSSGKSDINEDHSRSIFMQSQSVHSTELHSSDRGSNRSRTFLEDRSELVTSIIENYNEVFAMYSKKRAKELEVAACLRLASFLAVVPGRYRESLETAVRTGQVAESLRVSRKIQVWAMLATFLEGIGAKRQAALYLHRLASWNLEQSRMFEACALTYRTVNEFQSHQWVSIQRKLLLECSRLASDLGFKHDAVLRRLDLLRLGARFPFKFSDDEERKIDRESVAFLRLCGTELREDENNRVVDVLDCNPQPIQNLVLVEPSLESYSGRNESEEGVDFISKSNTVEILASKSPFIYSAIDSRGAMNASTIMKRTVWIQHEPAELAFTFRNVSSQPISVEILHILVSSLDDPQQASTQVQEKHQPLLKIESSRHEIPPTVDRGSESIPDRLNVNGTTFSTQVIPETVGSFLIEGISVRLFGGLTTTFHFQGQAENGGSNGSNIRYSSVKSVPVDVLPQLSKCCITVTIPRDSLQRYSSLDADQPLPLIPLYCGERIDIEVSIENCGSLPIEKSILSVDFTDSLLSGALQISIGSDSGRVERRSKLGSIPCGGGISVPISIEALNTSVPMPKSIIQMPIHVYHGAQNQVSSARQETIVLHFQPTAVIELSNLAISNDFSMSLCKMNHDATASKEQRFNAHSKFQLSFNVRNCLPSSDIFVWIAEKSEAVNESSKSQYSSTARPESVALGGFEEERLILPLSIQELSGFNGGIERYSCFNELIRDRFEVCWKRVDAWSDSYGRCSLECLAFDCTSRVSELLKGQSAEINIQTSNKTLEHNRSWIVSPRIFHQMYISVSKIGFGLRGSRMKVSLAILLERNKAQEYRAVRGIHYVISGSTLFHVDTTEKLSLVRKHALNICFLTTGLFLIRTHIETSSGRVLESSLMTIPVVSSWESRAVEK